MPLFFPNAIVQSMFFFMLKLTFYNQVNRKLFLKGRSQHQQRNQCSNILYQLLTPPPPKKKQSQRDDSAAKSAYCLYRGLPVPSMHVRWILIACSRESNALFWMKSLIPVLRKKRQEAHKFDMSLNYIVNSRLAWATQIVSNQLMNVLL